jgi:hypothetical protein
MIFSKGGPRQKRNWRLVDFQQPLGFIPEVNPHPEGGLGRIHPSQTKVPPPSNLYQGFPFFIWPRLAESTPLITPFIFSTIKKKKEIPFCGWQVKNCLRRHNKKSFRPTVIPTRKKGNVFQESVGAYPPLPRIQTYYTTAPPPPPIQIIIFCEAGIKLFVLFHPLEINS